MSASEKESLLLRRAVWCSTAKAEQVPRGSMQPNAVQWHKQAVRLHSHFSQVLKAF